MKTKMKKIFIFSAAFMLGLSAIGCSSNSHKDHSVQEEYINEEGNLIEPYDVAANLENKGPEGEYNEGVVLVKSFEDVDVSKLDLDIKSVERIYPGSPWQKIILKSGTSLSAVKYLRKIEQFEKVDYDYIMTPAIDNLDPIDVSSNTYASGMACVDTMGVGHAWAWGHYKHNHGEENVNAGGSPDVIVAVIDTGVDYNHTDLKNNIWTNTGETANNGIDDDGNGYIDDIHGWDCVNEDNDPMDDNGHGTHVAGIIAAENNNIGSVGIAFNCKVMPIKAGTHSGTFTNADIAQAITYAYMNGASVINMSFGGTSISLAVEDALTSAYNQCALIAAAGNSHKCSQPDCIYCIRNVAPFYPGSLPYVVGVMSCDNDGVWSSNFSNYDHSPYHYNQYEYDCYACGEQIISTWPNNKYAQMSGTSMASPAVAGIAALLRSAYPDRDTYSNKYIHSQLTNTGTKNVYVVLPDDSVIVDEYHPVCDAYEALSKIPTPHIYSVYNYYAFDNISLSEKNNQDGFINAGETIKLGVELQNRGGKAINVTATIDTIINNDPNLVDPNVDILNGTIQMDDIGTYSVGDGGKVYEDNKVVDMNHAFLIKIDEDTPNDYICGINLTISYNNGLDPNDHTLYVGKASIYLTVSRGVRLSGYITEDTILTADNEYFITDSLIVAQNATLTFQEGCKIQFYADSAAYIDTTLDTPRIDVYGSLVIDGSVSNPVTMTVSELYPNFCWILDIKNNSVVVDIDYANIYNLVVQENYNSGCLTITNSHIRYEKGEWDLIYFMKSGEVWCTSGFYSNFDIVDNCVFDLRRQNGINVCVNSMTNSVIIADQFEDSNSNFRIFYSSVENAKFTNNLFIIDKSNIHIDPSHYGISIHGNGDFSNNSFITAFVPRKLANMPPITVNSSGTFKDNSFANIYKDNQVALIKNNLDNEGHIKIDPTNEGDHDDSLIWPYIKDISIIDSDSHVVHTVGTEQNTVRVTFSRDMDTSNNFSLYYGSTYPYADYQIQGNYISDTVWEGTLKVKASIEGGVQYFSSKGGCAKNDAFKTLYDNAGAFTFNIDTSSAFSMNLQASPTEQGVQLSWIQDDYDTLMGYNVYRSESKDGNYSRLNSSIIPVGEHTFLDNSCQPGITYWYTFTVVLSDFSESSPAGRVSATPIDTVSPTIYHTPVNQGYENNNLVISCSASDNVAVTSVTLYYRTIGDANWKTLTMTKDNNRYSATIFGSEVTLDGLEYYISATDGRNVITRGSADSPYQVLVKQASALDNLGDVDGDGSITTRDALMIMQHINGDIVLTNDQFLRADLNKDTILSSYEALRILQYINGNVTSLEM